jgi:hypothetical protein
MAWLDKAGDWINLIYIASVCVTILTSLVVVFLSHQRAALKDLELKKVRVQAQERIAAANQRAAAANAAAAEAQAKAASATLAAAQLRKENLQLSIQLEREKELRLEAEKRAGRQPVGASSASQNPQARMLTAEQEQLLMAEMRRFGEKRVTIIELGDPEAGSLARQIGGVLEKAQWQVVVSRVGTLVPAQYGVICTHSPGDGPASALVSVLRSVNSVVYERTATVDQCQIIVGLKPPS